MKRETALLSAILIQTCLGMVYAWSTFVPALEREHGVTPAQTGLIFGGCIASFTVSMIFGGRLQKKQGPRRTAMTGGLLFLAGYLTGSASPANFLLMVLGFGLLAGAGIGFAYICPLATGIGWFPQQKGLITGLAVAGFGLGGVFFARVGQQMLDAQMPVLVVLQRIGLGVGITVMLGSVFLFMPPTVLPETGPTAEPRGSLGAILKQRRFRILFWQMFCGTFGGLLIIGNLKPIGLLNGLGPESATRAVMLFAAGNAAGRVLWGWLYDRIGPGVITLCLLLLAAGAAAMGFPNTPLAFSMATATTAFAFGGCFVLFAARVADDFGSERIGEIYPFVFLGYGIAGLAGPPAGGWLLGHTGAATLPCLGVMTLALLGAFSSARK